MLYWYYHGAPVQSLVPQGFGAKLESKSFNWQSSKWFSSVNPINGLIDNPVNPIDSSTDNTVDPVNNSTDNPVNPVIV